jgi:catechol 2,3-dioxygenase-like lactoylglutathione lyase family enzyme
MTHETETVSVRNIVDDVPTAIRFYTTHLGFVPLTNQGPAFADVKRANLRLLLSGEQSSAGRPTPKGQKPGPGESNRIHVILDDIDPEVGHLRGAGVTFRNDMVSGPGAKQILLEDSSGNPIELFQPAGR